MKPIYLACIVMLSARSAFAQEPPKELEELRIKLNESGSHYLKATFLNQVWVRFNDSNPGTCVLGEPASQTMDIGLRRTRMQLYGQLTDHVFLLQFDKTISTSSRRMPATERCRYSSMMPGPNTRLQNQQQTGSGWLNDCQRTIAVQSAPALAPS